MARRRKTRRTSRHIRMNGRRRRRSRRSSRMALKMNRLVRNVFGANITQDVVMPVLGGTVGFVAARYLGNMLAERSSSGTLGDPRIAKTAAAALGIPATFWLAKKSPTVARNSNMIALGMGIAAAESWLRDTPLLGGAPAAALVTSAPSTESAPSSGDGTSGIGAYYSAPMAGLADYYSEAMLGGLGAEPGNQGAVDDTMNKMEAVSTVTPTDLAMPAPTMPQVAPVSEPFAEGDKGQAGGLFARHLFSGMYGA